MFRKIYDNFEEIFCACCIAVMVACLITQVVIRVTMGSSLAWTEELSRYSFLWTVYIGAAMVAKNNAHVRITSQFLLFSVRIRLFLRLFADIIWVIATLYIAWKSWVVIVEGMEFPEVSPTLHIVKAYVEMIIPIGFIIMAWRIVEVWLKNYRLGTLALLLHDEEA